MVVGRVGAWLRTLDPKQIRFAVSLTSYSLASCEMQTQASQYLGGWGVESVLAFLWHHKNVLVNNALILRTNFYETSWVLHSPGLRVKGWKGSVWTGCLAAIQNWIVGACFSPPLCYVVTIWAYHEHPAIMIAEKGELSETPVCSLNTDLLASRVECWGPWLGGRSHVFGGAHRCTPSFSSGLYRHIG